MPILLLHSAKKDYFFLRYYTILGDVRLLLVSVAGSRALAEGVTDVIVGQTDTCNLSLVLLQTAYMAEREDSFWDKETRDRWNDIDRLTADARQAEEQIENGSDTSAAQLDRFLAAEASYLHWSAQHALPTEPWEGIETEEREEKGVQYLQIQKVLTGSYYKEKADYCNQMYQFHRGKAEEGEEKISAGLENPDHTSRLEARIARSRMWAANWLRTEANCLTMPEARPHPREQQEQSQG